MELRGLRAGYVAVLVVMMGAGSAAAFPKVNLGVPEGAMPIGPLVGVVPVAALTEDEAVAMLESDGYVVVETRRTWLGRIVITAEGKAGTREIVLHPYDGEVLRDVIVEPAVPPAAEAVADGAVPEAEAAVEEPAAEAGEDTSADAGDDDTPDGAVLPLIPDEPAS